MTRLVYKHWHSALDPDECISVDGASPGRLHLSHWPVNRTPDRFRHDLSTGMCLLLGDAPDREQLLSGITAVTNNHYDTDGVCSVFVCIEPALAKAHAHTLVAAAAAGDFSLFTTPEGVKLDLTLTALTKAENSPVKTSLFTSDREARQAQYDFALQHLPQWLANPDTHADWFAREFWTIQQHLRLLREEDAEVEIFHSLDLAVITTAQPLHETAVNTATACDRILTVLSTESGAAKYEVRLTTLSWFDLQSRPYKPRLDWSELALRLNEEAPGDGTWQADDISDPTPKLVFADKEGISALNATQPAAVRRIVADFFTASPHLPAGI